MQMPGADRGGPARLRVRRRGLRARQPHLGDGALADATSSPPRRSWRRAATRCCGRARCSPGARRRSAARRASSTRATARPRATSPGPAGRDAARRAGLRGRRPARRARRAAATRATSSATASASPSTRPAPRSRRSTAASSPGLLIGSMVAGGWDNPTPCGLQRFELERRRRLRRWRRRGRLRRRRRRGRLRWRQLLGAARVSLVFAPSMLAHRPSAPRAASSAAADALRDDPVYVDPAAELAGQVDAAALRARIDAQGRADVHRRPARERDRGQRGPDADRPARGRRRERAYALAVGDEFRTIPADAGREPLAPPTRTTCRPR